MFPGDCLTVENPGGDLTVTITGADGQIDALFLEGPTEVVKIYEL